MARRLAAEPVVVLFALRDPGDGDASAFVGLPDLWLVGLSDADARALLAAAVRTPLDDVVRDQVVAEARGDPLALLELPRAATPGRLAGGFELPDVLSGPRRVEDSFQSRSGRLPVDTQVLLLIAAAGEHPRSRSAQPSDALTAQELQITRLVATGATSREVSAELS